MGSQCNCHMDVGPPSSLQRTPLFPTTKPNLARDLVRPAAATASRYKYGDHPDSNVKYTHGLAWNMTQLCHRFRPLLNPKKSRPYSYFQSLRGAGPLGSRFEVVLVSCGLWQEYDHGSPQQWNLDYQRHTVHFPLESSQILPFYPTYVSRPRMGYGRWSHDVTESSMILLYVHHVAEQGQLDHESHQVLILL